MKKLGLVGAAVLAAVSLAPLSASAGYPPPTGPTVVLTPGTVVVNAQFTATFFGCTPPESVSIVFQGVTVTVTCGPAASAFRRPAITALPSASATLTAPGTPGQYPVSATGLTSGSTDTATLTVVASAGELPATGSDSAPTVQIASGIAAAGAALLLVGVRRRRAASSTA